MKRIYITTQCCNVRRAAFASPEIRRNGDYTRWYYGIRDTKRIASGELPEYMSAPTKVYMIRSARAVLNMIGAN